MALSSGCLVTSIISPRAGKGDPDCPKTKLTVRLHPREYFPAFYASRCACVIHFWILEGVVGRLVLSFEQSGSPFPARVRIKDNKNSPHGKFHRLLFPFSSKFSDLNFASYVLYNLPVLCHVSHKVSLGYLWGN